MFSRSVVYSTMLGLILSPVWITAAEPAPGTAQTPLVDVYGDALPHGAILRIGTTRLHHGDFINQVAFTSDGKTVISCSWDGTLRSWDAATGKEIHCFRGHKSAVMSFSISKDGKTLASISQDFTIRLWDIATGKELRKLDAIRGAYYDLAFSPDGQTLASCGQHIRIWDAKTYQVIREFEKEVKWVHCLAFSPDGKKLAAGDQNGVICLWETGNWKEIRRFTAHTNGIQSIAFSPNGNFLASSGDDGLLSLRNPETGEEIRALCKREPRGCSRLAFSPDSKIVAWSWGPEGIIRLFEASTGKEVRQIKSIPPGIKTIAFSPDGKSMVSGSAGTIRLWDMESAKEIIPFHNPQNPVANLVFCADDTILAGAPWGDTIYCWDSAVGKELRQLKGHGEWLHFMAASPDGRTLFSAASDGCVHRWDLSQGKELQCFRLNGTGTALALSLDGRTVAAEDFEFKAGRLYDLQSGKEVGHFGAACGIIFFPDGKSLMLHVPAQGLARWDIAAGKIAYWLPGDNRSNRCMAVSADGKIFVSGTSEDRVHRWDMETGEKLSSLDGQQKSIQCVVFSPDGRTLASGGQDGTIWLREMLTGRRRLVLQGHKGSVLSATFSSDGRRLASGSWDATVLIWDLTEGLSMDRPKAFTAEQMNGFWRDLTGEDAAKAYRSMWLLVGASKQSLPFLQARLRPIPVPDSKRIAQLLLNLDSADFRTRTKAREELERLGEAVAAPLRETVEKPPSLEVSLRVKDLLDKLKAERRTPSPERRRVLRAVEVLEHIGTAEARKLLKDLADGAAEAQLTQETKASLDRIAKRMKRSK